MKLDEGARIVLDNIDFVGRCMDLSRKFNSGLHDSFEHYSNENALKIIEDLGYVAKYKKKDDFFQIIENTDEFKFQLNIVLKHGLVNFIWSAWKIDYLIPLGGPWGVTKRLLDHKSSDKYTLPVFRSYDDLKEILGIAFKIFEDFMSGMAKE